MEQISQTKHNNIQPKEFKDIQITSNEVNVNQISQINKKDNSTQNEPLKPLEIISISNDFKASAFSSSVNSSTSSVP